jgi:hypothetical protein
MRDPRSPRPSSCLRTSLALSICSLFLVSPAAAPAETSDTRLIDGPSAEVVEAADAAMAEDGSGGLVYLKEVGGRKHVFVVRFDGGAWSAPMRVDLGQEFDSTWPRIAAGNNGRLLVTWVQEFGVGTDRIFSASLDPGASGFAAPVPVDFNVGEATATYPDIAMSPGGQAYLAYVVVTDTSPANPPGYVGASIRVARYNNRLWSLLGTAINRNPAFPLRLPTEASEPRIGVDLRGNAVVAWQEPDDEFVDRIWARRVFGTSLGIPLQVSPSIWEGAPLRAPADAFGLDVSGFGQAAVAVRQQPDQGSAISAPRVFVNEIPDPFSPGGAAFAGPRLVDGGPRGELGTPSVGVEPNGGFVAGFSSGAATMLGAGDLESVGAVKRIDPGTSVIAGEPLVDLSEAGASVAVWREQRATGGLVGVLEARADGVDDPATLRAPRGGAVGPLRIGGSGLGDALLAWTQGTGANTQILSAVVDAPPDPFNVEAPEGWKRKAEVTIHWPQATNAISSVKYSVSVDDEPIGKPTGRLFARLKTKRIGDGRHRIQIFAIDEEGQQTGSRKAALLIDRKPPKVELRRHGRAIAVVISDGPRRETSGVKAKAVRVGFGDGSGTGKGGGGGGGKGPTTISAAPKKGKKQVVKTLRHAYPHSGTYRVVVTARDRAGNTVHYERKLRVG